MKKLLLFFAIIINMTASSQNFWTEVSDIFPDSDYYTGEISVVDNDVIWVNGKRGCNFDCYSRKYSRSNDGGLTWTSGNYSFLPAISRVTVGGIKAISINTAYVTVFGGFGDPNDTAYIGVWHTADGGTTWTKQQSASFTNPASFPNFVHFWNDNDGIVIGDPVNGYYEIYTTSNGGTNWNLLPVTNIPLPFIDEYAFPELYEIVGNTIWFGTSRGRIFKSIDKGLNWTVSQSPLNDFVAISGGDRGNFSFKNQDEGILRDSNLNYYKTFDSGNTWNSITTNGTVRDYNANYIPNTQNTVFQFGKDENDFRGSSYSLDGGSSWIDLNNVDNDPIIPYSVKFQSGTVGYCIGVYTNPASNTISNNIYQPKFFRLTDPQQRLTGNSLANNSFNVNSKVTMFPNPTTGLVKISGSKIQNVSITDVLGKEVYSEKLNSVDSAILDITNLQKGVYLVKISDNSGAINSMKIIKD